MDDNDSAIMVGTASFSERLKELDSSSSIFSDMQSDDSLYDHSIFSDATHSGESDGALSPKEVSKGGGKRAKTPPPIMPRTFEHNMPGVAHY